MEAKITTANLFKELLYMCFPEAAELFNFYSYHIRFFFSVYGF